MLNPQDHLFEIIGANQNPETTGVKEASQAGILRKLRIKRFPIAAAAVLLLIILGCVFCGLFTGEDPFRMELTHINAAPDKAHIFGTDTLGRDIWSIIWYGGRRSLFIGAFATLISTGIAVIYGSISGLAGRVVDSVMMRFSEILLSIPSLLLIIFVQAVIGQRNVIGISIIIGITGWMSVAKMVRTEVKRIRDSEYVLISKMMGGNFFHVMRKHLAPNFAGTIMFMVVMNIRSAIVSESTLSFLGIGLPVDIITWGSMLSLSDKALLTGSWWIILIPGVFLVVTLLCVTELGNYFRGSKSSLHGNL
jgi:peptide/nickel transport system permease protein